MEVKENGEPETRYTEPQFFKCKIKPTEVKEGDLFTSLLPHH